VRENFSSFFFVFLQNQIFFFFDALDALEFFFLTLSRFVCFCVHS
jgi:hypothetical protein